MKIPTFHLFAWFVLASCTQDIAGLDRSERFAAYGAVATAAGHPEAGVALGATSAVLRAVDRQRMAAKQPLNVQP